jgi:hypothetical protein
MNGVASLSAQTLSMTGIAQALGNIMESAFVREGSNH